MSTKLHLALKIGRVLIVVVTTPIMALFDFSTLLEYEKEGMTVGDLREQELLVLPEVWKWALR